MDQDFEEMKVVKFQCLLKEICCSLPSLKKATKNQAILGIILSSISLVLGAGGNFISAGLKSASGSSDAAIAYVSGAGFLLEGTLLLVYNLLLLSSVRANHGVRVFKIIKVGCLILLYLGLILDLLALSGLVILTASSQIPVGGMIAGIVFVLLGLLLSALVIYAIHSVKPKIVTVYIYITGVCFTIFVLVGIVSSFYLPVFIINFFLMILTLDYYLNMFVLHLNMMIVGPVINNHHHQLT